MLLYITLTQLTTHLIAKGNKLPASKLNVRCKPSSLLLRKSSVDSSTPNSFAELLSYESFLKELSLLKIYIKNVQYLIYFTVTYNE
jgi:hypothetical protein